MRMFRNSKEHPTAIVTLSDSELVLLVIAAIDDVVTLNMGVVLLCGDWVGFFTQKGSVIGYVATLTLLKEVVVVLLGVVVGSVLDKVLGVVTVDVIVDDLVVGSGV
jgi:hypothetical protein